MLLKKFDKELWQSNTLVVPSEIVLIDSISGWIFSRQFGKGDTRPTSAGKGCKLSTKLARKLLSPTNSNGPIFSMSSTTLMSSPRLTSCCNLAVPFVED